MAGAAVLFSKYYSELEGEAKSRYEQKVRMIGLVDPYFFCWKTVLVVLPLRGMV